MKYWWKALGVLIVLYSIVAGLLAPLKTGIIKVEPRSLQTGQAVVLEVEGYNSFFTKNKDALRAWLRSDSAVLAAHRAEVLDDRHLRLHFSIPAFLPVGEKVVPFTLVVDSPGDGAALLPSAVLVTQDSISPAAGKARWTDAAIAGTHSKPGVTFPFRNILGETIRNTFYHVPLWFAMFFLFIAAVVFSVRHLRRLDPDDDRKAVALTSAGILFGLLGLATGAVWAKHTWGAYWSWDVKQNMTAVGLLIYCAYFVLRGSFDDPEKKARISAVYNIFAFATLIPLMYVVPKLTDSLHPGAGGNIAFGSDDMDNTMRLIFYPAIIGWTLVGLWMAEISLRAARLRDRLLE